MPITAYQCRAARGLFAMTKQELADASGVSLRTITSFEDVTDRMPIAANLIAIEAAFLRLGVVFVAGRSGVEWVSPFSEAQVRVIRTLQVRHGPAMATPEDLAATGCSRSELDWLVWLGLVDGIDRAPVLTAIGHHVPRLLDAHDARVEARKYMFGELNYSVFEDDGRIFHAQTGAVLDFKDDGTMKVLSYGLTQPDEYDALITGACEALREHRERAARIKGMFVWMRT